MEPLEAAYLSIKDRWGGTLEQFSEVTQGWDVHPVSVGGDVVGAILVNGPEIHACIASGYGRWFRKEQARVLNGVIEKHGYAQTHATTQAGIDFVQRLGFEPHGNAFRRYSKWALKR